MGRIQSEDIESLEIQRKDRRELVRILKEQLSGVPPGSEPPEKLLQLRKLQEEIAQLESRIDLAASEGKSKTQADVQHSKPPPKSDSLSIITAIRSIGFRIAKSLRDPIWQSIAALAAIAALGIALLAWRLPQPPLTVTPVSMAPSETILPLTQLTFTPTAIVTQTPYIATTVPAPRLVTSTPTSYVVTNTPTPTPTPWVVTNTPTVFVVTNTPTPVVVTNTPTPTSTPDLERGREAAVDVVQEVNRMFETALADIENNWSLLKPFFCGEQAEHKLAAFKEWSQATIGPNVIAHLDSQELKMVERLSDGRWKVWQKEIWIYLGEGDSQEHEDYYRYYLVQTDASPSYCINEYYTEKLYRR